MSETNGYDVRGLTPEQALEMAQDKGVELTSEQLDQIARWRLDGRGTACMPHV